MLLGGWRVKEALLSLTQGVVVCRVSPEVVRDRFRLLQPYALVLGRSVAVLYQCLAGSLLWHLVERRAELCLGGFDLISFSTEVIRHLR